jgi:hypothetical protein
MVLFARRKTLADAQAKDAGEFKCSKLPRQFHRKSSTVSPVKAFRAIAAE